MCEALDLNRSTYYYEPKDNVDNLDEDIEDDVIEEFNNSRKIYGARKIREKLIKNGHKVSRKRIRRVMIKNNLNSKYTVKRYRNHASKVNEDKVENIVNREFDDRKHLEVVVSDLTYVRVANTWHYICILVDIFNREIIGYAAGANKDSELVVKAFTNLSNPISSIDIFHTDRGSEFKNKVINEMLDTFKINRSLSKKGCPYDNAVAEATFKTIKVELISGNKYSSLEELKLDLFDYVNWYNNHRIHGSLDYMTPVEYKEKKQNQQALV